jgi:hypothetical protein
MQTIKRNTIYGDWGLGIGKNTKSPKIMNRIFIFLFLNNLTFMHYKYLIFNILMFNRKTQIVFNKFNKIILLTCQPANYLNILSHIPSRYIY